MATVAKFYLLDAATPNTGTMPGAGTAYVDPVIGAGTSATGSRTARDATDVHGSSNPDIESLVTAAANTTGQRLEHRRFVSRPLAATTFATADGNWVFTCACYESNTNHQGGIYCRISIWRPSSGLRVGTQSVGASLVPNTGTFAPETTAEVGYGSETTANTWSGTQAILDGDILVFEISDIFTQAMATAYTSSFAYDGTTDPVANVAATTCASYVAPPAALTLFSSTVETAPSPRPIPFQSVGRNL